MTALRRLLVPACVAWVGACSGGRVEVQLRVPAGDHPLVGADRVALSVRDGGGALLAFATSGAGASELRLPPVPAGSGYTVEVEARVGADVLARGRSCRFDVNAAAPPRVPVWFSRVGRFAPTASPHVARDGAVAVGWAGGALVAGGNGTGAPLASSESYDATTAAFRDGPMLSTGRAGAQAVDLGDGTVLIIGGAVSGAPALEALAPTHTTPEPAGLSPDLVGHAAARLGDGRVIIAGGLVAGAPTATAWLATDGGATVEAAPALGQARARLTLTATSDDRFAPLYVVGGVGAAGPVAELELFDPVASAFSDTGLRLATPRADHSTTRLPSGLLLVVGGVDASGAPLASAELIDPAAHTVRAAGRLRTARAHHAATLLPTGRLLISGGVDASGAPMGDAEIFDPSLGADGDFVPTASLAAPRAGHTLVPLCDGTLVVVGGGAGAEIYNPL